ncbi:aminotransferase class III-fold pyridoxal phosphate-dependent enzyme [Microbacterium sp. HD4P20]|uniref:aspartate aminotransferase family protein n=1 Tax=Microbacterium sp. HD4P20 TaxID=2864874 RepID=UPI001C6406D7|nr:aminotransferase class III-fold pyridoxal phosphate-dependent enzyme [Microbacterium sp. HD4P20]MCP2635039.1 aminotransferase class III-fold pyridoxal phosphate-dependent enzyme [Microbacterium sp. HD4P20]
MTEDLLERRFATIGRHSPLFYDQPVHLVSGSGVWLTDADGRRYLDAYNNVPHVGHAHPRVVEALCRQAATLNIHTRYLDERVVEYAEELLGRFEPELDRVVFANSGSEANELAFRVALQHTGARGILVTDYSYHGNTSLLAGLTTGLKTHEGLAPHVRSFPVPDMDAAANDGRDPAVVRDEALRHVDEAIDQLLGSGFGVAAVIVESIFSTEGLPRVPAGFVEGVAARVRAAGGLVIGDEVQAGLGRTGSTFWGYQRYDLVPDLVTLGKPLGNGHPLAATVTTAALWEEFGARNEFFNTFAGNPVSSAVGLEVLRIIDDEGLFARSARLGSVIRSDLTQLTAQHDRLGPVKGDGLFFGFSVFEDAGHARPDGPATRRLVEEVKRRGVLLSRIGPTGSVLKIRPPLALQDEDVPTLTGALRESVLTVLGQP